MPSATSSSHFAPDFDNASYDFMTRNAWVDRPTPFVTDNMQIGMTDPAEKNLDLHIARLRIAAVEGEWIASRRYHDPFLFSRVNESQPRRRCRGAKL